MKIYVPDYYKDFECIKDNCRHSCCIGWEIDIDSDTLSYYESVEGKFGERLKCNISYEDTPHFILGEDERCPFLNSSNLCDIYIHCGREHLCDICSNHPRFVNVFSHREEWGLGLCCEAAAHIILNKKSVTKMICDDTDCQIEEVISIRENILSIVQDRKVNINRRFENLMKQYNVDFPEYDFEQWKEVFLSLEILDSEWIKVIKCSNAPDYSLTETQEYQLSLEQLAVYFLLRYINKENEENIKGIISFCFLGVYMIWEIFCRSEDKSKEKLEDICRMYSAEIEYSLDNINDLLFELA